VAHAYNPCYSGGKDQEDHSSKPAQANSSQDPILQIPNTKSVSGVAQGVALSSSPSTANKTKQNKDLQRHG
jgi:hypothetical protein